jgi:hypothetical protein
MTQGAFWRCVWRPPEIQGGLHFLGEQQPRIPGVRHHGHQDWRRASLGVEQEEMGSAAAAALRHRATHRAWNSRHLFICAGGVFRVKWDRVADVPFKDTLHIYNPCVRLSGRHGQDSPRLTGGLPAREGGTRTSRSRSRATARCVCRPPPHSPLWRAASLSRRAPAGAARGGCAEAAGALRRAARHAGQQGGVQRAGGRTGTRRRCAAGRRARAWARDRAGVQPRDGARGCPRGGPRVRAGCPDRSLRFLLTPARSAQTR